jgi:predicted lipoprotein with Yx(FWY)xxD motif
LLVLLLAAAMAQAESSDGFSVNISENKFIGSYLVNQSGFALYYFEDDKNAGGASSCYGDCAQTWPPFYTEEILVPDGLRAVDFATIARTDGLNQTTYKGWPLYLYSGDEEEGDVYGSNREDGLWHAVNPSDMSELF